PTPHRNHPKKVKPPPKSPPKKTSTHPRPNPVQYVMGFVKYDQDLKVIAVKLSLRCGTTFGGE
ncbi:hypothetical protein PCASD_26755, partial [Puccinia coronata f. sp. avenae]